MPGYSSIASPLTELLKADKKFEWTDECQQAFNKLRDALCDDVCLKRIDMAAPFVLRTDASGEGKPHDCYCVSTTIRNNQ